jgi:hypothetical protein
MEEMMIALDRQTPYKDNRAGLGEVAIIPVGTKAALQRLCGFYGGSERELLARVISDLERDTLASLRGGEREDYFASAA